MLTPAQNNRVIGFNASLKTRGVVLSLKSITGIISPPPTFRCILEPKSTMHLKKYETVTDELVTDLVHASRADVAAIETANGSIESGSIFFRTDSAVTYRVHQRVDESANVAAIVFHCIAKTPTTP